MVTKVSTMVWYGNYHGASPGSVRHWGEHFVEKTNPSNPEANPWGALLIPLSTHFPYHAAFSNLILSEQLRIARFRIVQKSPVQPRTAKESSDTKH